VSKIALGEGAIAPRGGAYVWEKLTCESCFQSCGFPY